MVKYDSDGRALPASGMIGPDSIRDRSVDLEIFTGELGCGDLTYELKLQFDRVDPGTLVRIVTDDPGAKNDLPAWCKMMRHKIIQIDPPYYIIEARKPRC